MTPSRALEDINFYEMTEGRVRNIWEEKVLEDSSGWQYSLCLRRKTKWW